MALSHTHGMLESYSSAPPPPAFTCTGAFFPTFPLVVALPASMSTFPPSQPSDDPDDDGHDSDEDNRSNQD